MAAVQSAAQLLEQVGHKPEPEGGKHLKMESVEYPINNLSPGTRANLTRAAVHEEIFRDTGAAVTTRGSFNGNPPLHLYLTADTKDKLAAAEASCVR